jgi:predicted dehydrogenase
MRKIRVGVIGAGYWGPNLIRNFHEIDQAQLTMVCDTKQERLDHIQVRYPYVKVTQNYQELLDSDIEAVVIATPVSTHFPIAMACLQAGKHVLIEKPLAGSAQDAQMIAQQGEEKVKIVMTGHTFLFNPAVEAIKEIIQSGEIGQVFYINCIRVNLGLFQPDVNVIWDLAPHDISILMYILGLDPVSINSLGGSYIKPGVIDVAYLTLSFPSGVMANLRMSWLDPVKTRQITVVGSKKMIVYDDINPHDKVKIYDKGIDIQPYSDTLEEFQLAYRSGEVMNYPLKWQEPLKLECNHFLECIEHHQTPRSDGWFGLRVVQALEMAQYSINNGGGKVNIE